MKWNKVPDEFVYVPLFNMTDSALCCFLQTVTPRIYRKLKQDGLDIVFQGCSEAVVMNDDWTSNLRKRNDLE